ncbi:hypothetical protein [Bordetella genomosp. 4]|uniref:Uncharacterized protein n=1 Tax=Bordetella genomosp. 4 TaxID=463044 RepID=A0A261URS5_9BORD|nr:hypothetical protein [Bordetella genomosp. 4]OZI64596.1 hypothetical protein CAL20_02770 [Bordetella genomosp. 4]
MKTLTAIAPPYANRKRISPAKVVDRLVDFIAPKDHAGRGNWDNNDRIPLGAWLGALLFVVLYLVVLPWLGRGAGF